MAGLEEEDNFDEENFQDTSLLTFPPDVQGVLDEVYIYFLKSVLLSIATNSGKTIFSAKNMLRFRPGYFALILIILIVNVK